jgi:hypothetical protein
VNPPLDPEAQAILDATQDQRIERVERLQHETYDVMHGLRADMKTVFRVAAVVVTMVSVMSSLFWWTLERGVDEMARQGDAIEETRVTAEEARATIKAWVSEATRWGNTLDEKTATNKSDSRERHEKQQKQIDRHEQRLDGHDRDISALKRR